MVREMKSYGNPAVREGAVVQGENYRFSVLTPSLIRLEYSASGEFEDRATQVVMNREFSVPEFQVMETSDSVEISTYYLCLIFKKQEFTRESLSIRVLVNPGTGENRTWFYGDVIKDLKGTARTLDTVDGAIPLEHGLISREGYSLIDDSRTMVIAENGWVSTRKGNGTDLYFFGYGHRYQECIRDFYRLCGNTPLIPRWALGNWWSRYHRYTEEEYKRLITRFREEHLPFSVAVIDMDWHLVDIPKKYGTGWTGYTWNEELFPDPPEFLGWLHGQGYRTTLNVHPADGVRAHEKAYPAMAEALSIDPETEEPVSFDVTNQAFLEAYFDILHRPMEEEGVDFWWVDWQQGRETKIPGLDPLWMLNHYHYLNSMRTGKCGLTFSRYAGIGSHRYPIGFSGDTIISWESLAFQPYFTANASNVGYGWWSHDIGGHMFGVRDDELSVRWIQFGVFSPINRLHSSSSPFSGKEPWNFNKRAELIMGKFLRLRHELIPYLYTMDRYASRDGRPLVRPLYWEHPETESAYEFPNEYYFGSELLIAPITEPMDRETDAARVKAWIPEGLWFDYQKGRMYRGGRKMLLYRTLEELPVLAKAGAILVRSLEETNSTGNPEALAVDIFPGADGSFSLWEDDGCGNEDSDENWVCTKLKFWQNDGGWFTIGVAEGNQEVLPGKRSWKLNFRNVDRSDVVVTVGGRVCDAVVTYEESRKIMIVELQETDVTETVEVMLNGTSEPVNITKSAQAFEVLNRAQIAYECKEAILDVISEQEEYAFPTLQAMELNQALLGELGEILFSV